MRVLLDNNIDHRFLKLLPGHEVVHVQKIGWAGLQNGALIAVVERDGFGVLVTADKNLQFQQSLKGRKISVITLRPHFVDFQGIAPLVPKILTVLDNLPEGSFVVINPDSSE